MSDTVPLVSIALPVFNGGQDILPAVQSIVSQSFTDWELILIDDGSTDDTLARLRTLADPRIRVVADGANRGLAARLNEAIQLSRGPYFARMDHDDFAHPQRLQLQVDYLQSHADVDLLATHCFSMSEDERIIGELPFAATHAEICRRPWLGFYMAHPTWMGRTDWFRKHRYAEPGPYCCEDQELLLRAFDSSHYHALSAPLLAYRVRGRVGIRKLGRTRLALARVQVARFVMTRRFGFVLLSLAAVALRTVSDLLRPSIPSLRSDVRPTALRQEAEWEEMISANRRQAKSLAGR